ncbi:MAG: flagellar export chaperone FliS, partial [bacterium]
MPQAHPYSAYTRTNVNTADQRQLILMLYDGAIRNARKGIAKIEARDFEAAHNYLIRARQIVSELLATLRPEKAGEIGQNLKRLYVYL